MSKPRNTPDGVGDRSNSLDALRNPVGPKDRKVYIRRRIIVLAVLLAIVAVVVLVFLKPGASGGVRDTAQVEVPSDLPRDTVKTKGDGVPACTSEQLVVVPITDRADYAEGEMPQLSLSVKNNGAKACAADLGTAGMTFTISSGDDEVWRSVDCQKNPTNQMIVLEPRKELSSETVQWDRTRSDPETCEVPREPVASGGASYHLTAEAGGATSNQSIQFLLY